MSEFFNSKENIRKKVIGLGETSTRKNYYPQLQERIDELVEQKILLEQKNSELIETQTLLISNEYKYRTLFESANDAIFILNAETYDFVDCNTKALKLLDYKSKEELLSTYVGEHFPELQPNGQVSKKLAEEILIEVISGNIHTFEWVMKRKNNVNVFCIVSLNYIELLGDRLIQAIIRDVSNIRKLEHELSMATIRTEEKERKRFAKELHDGIGPILSTIKLYLEWLKEENEIEQNNTILNKANHSIVEATNALKEISYNLSPHVLSNYGLLDAVNQFIDKIKLVTPIQIDCIYDLKNRLNNDLEVMFYRIITELINNTIKYAKASKIEINMQNNGNSIVFKYTDDGIGFNVENERRPDKGMGLYNIENRVRKFGGTVKFISEVGNGLAVEIFINEINLL